ncbi:MAG: acyclic terpene utilization AtuA family protein [Balneolaceae bacterium]
MPFKHSIRIASGQGFWGDLPAAPLDQIRKGPIDYLVMDYLAEVTMSILHKQKARTPEAGYAKDFIDLMKEALPELREKKIRVVCNAGGANPTACKDALLSLATELGEKDLTVAVVDGDDILHRIGEMINRGFLLENMDSGKEISTVQEKLRSANIYFGCQPIVDALARGADIVITGRVTDTSLILGPLVHEFGWPEDDYDRLSAGTIAGHIIECGAQASGGNFTDWKRVESFESIGFPIIEAYPDGTFVVTKHPGTGGLIDEMTVKEQLLYEIADPSSYITPDVTADFTSVRLAEEGMDRVRVSGITGKPKTDSYKVSASYHDGYKLSSTLVYCWPDPVEKALCAAEILRRRLKNLGIELTEYRAELIGLNACSEEEVIPGEAGRGLNEISLRISMKGDDRRELERAGKEIIPLILTGPGGVTGYAGGRPKASEVIAFWPALIGKDAVEPKVSIFHP